PDRVYPRGSRRRQSAGAGLRAGAGWRYAGVVLMSEPLAPSNPPISSPPGLTPSLMAPFQVLFVRGLKNLYGRGSKKEEFAAIDAYFRSPNPQAVLLFVADHLRIPTDLRKMDFQDKERYDRIRETLGDWCGFVELARVDESDAIKWVMNEAEGR